MAYSSKEFTNLSKDLSAKVFRTLGTLVGTDSNAYYTASDVAQKIAGSHSTKIPKDFTKFLAEVSSILSLANTKGTNNVRRTSKRIPPKLYLEGNMSYGYRIGMALGTPIVNEDTVRESKHNTECYEALLEQKMPTAMLLVEELNYADLAKLQQAIIARMAVLHEVCENTAAVLKHINQR